MIVYKQTVQPKDCDIYQHMNTLKYMEKFYEAADDYMMKYGITDPILAGKGIGCAYLEFNTKFIKEVFAGTAIVIDVSVQEIGTKVVTIILKMLDSESQQLLSEAVLKFLFFDLEKRKSMKLSDDKIQALNLDWLNNNLNNEN